MTLSPVQTDLRIWRRHGAAVRRTGEYFGCTTRTEFTCEAGHNWSALPDTVAGGAGCKACGAVSAGLKNRMGEDTFRVRLSAEHGDNIELVDDFTALKKKATFRCAAGHVWSTLPQTLLVPGSACPQCCRSAAGSARRASAESIAKRIHELHGDKVRLVDQYTHKRAKLRFACDHNHEWLATFENVGRGSQCPTCAKLRQSQRVTKSLSAVTHEVALRHGDQIKLKQGYLRRSSKAEFECRCGHTWQAVVHNVIIGCGCPRCAVGGFDPTRPALLYYLRVEGGDPARPLYKIGVTNYSVQQRFAYSCDRQRIRLLRSWEYQVGSEALGAERKVLSEFVSDRYTGAPILRGSGNTELFTRDVLNLDA